MKKIWLCYSSFGGGHLSPAKAIGQALEKQYPGQFLIQYINIMENVPAWLRHVLENWYSNVVNGHRKSFYFSFFLTNFILVRWVQNCIVYLFSRRRLRSALVEDAPDAVLMAYFYTTAVSWVIKSLPKPPKMFVAVTDPFTTSPLWFARAKFIKYFLFSERLARTAHRWGVPMDRLIVTSFPIRPGFEARPTTRISPHPQVLIGGGGVGMDKLFKFLVAAEKLPANVTLHVVCGHSPVIEAKIKKYAAEHPQRSIKVYGFVEDMADLMRQMDLFIGKAGASFTFEAVGLQKPVIFIDYIWYQEKGNIDYVVDNNLGWYEPNVEKAVKIINDLFSNQPLLNDLDARLKKHNFKSGAGFIADRLALEVL